MTHTDLINALRSEINLAVYPISTALASGGKLSVMVENYRQNPTEGERIIRLIVRLFNGRMVGKNEVIV